jgi:hypothetical protein
MVIYYQKCRIHPPTPEPVGVGDHQRQHSEAMQFLRRASDQDLKVINISTMEAPQTTLTYRDPSCSIFLGAYQVSPLAVDYGL